MMRPGGMQLTVTPCGPTSRERPFDHAWTAALVGVAAISASISAESTPVLHAFNKVDRLDPASLAALRERLVEMLPGSVFVSAVAPAMLITEMEVQKKETSTDKPPILPHPGHDPVKGVRP